MRFSVLAFALLLHLSSFANPGDTLDITSKHISTAVLKQGTNQYLVYFKMGKDKPISKPQFWTRTIRLQNNNQLVIDQRWVAEDTVVHTTHSVCDAKTFSPVTHEFWWKSGSQWINAGTTKVDFPAGKLVVNDHELSDQDTAQRFKEAWQGFTNSRNQTNFNWHLDLEVFSTLPFKKDAVFRIPFYDPATRTGLQQVVYAVTGSAQLEGYDQQKIDCWLLVHETKGNKETFWISKKTKEVLKLEQVINNQFYRYKVKIATSSL